LTFVHFAFEASNGTAHKVTGVLGDDSVERFCAMRLVNGVRSWAILMIIGSISSLNNRQGVRAPVVTT
jgi:hypothetical protein